MGGPIGRDIRAVFRLARRLRGAGFDRVYDLQTSTRSSRYRWFVGRRAAWSGIAPRRLAPACQSAAAT